MNNIATLPEKPQAEKPVKGNTPFELAQREALALTTSSLVPKDYRGRDNIGNALIAVEIAKRLGASPLLVMQNLHIIQGKPSWSSTFLIASVNACGRFSPMRFEKRGDDPEKDDYRVRAFAEDKASGERCEGPWVTWAMAKAEGWATETGSKWKTMPELMFMYRAAGFWTRLFAPEVSMGILTREEVEDVWGDNRPALPSVPAATKHDRIGQLEAELSGAVINGEVVDTSTGEVLTPEKATYEDVKFLIDSAQDLPQLDAAFALVEKLPEGDVAELTEAYRARRVSLTSE